MRDIFANFQHIQVIDWLNKDDQYRVFSETDLAITRGSATTLAELEIFRIKKIIIPLPHAAKNHQYYNAREYESRGDILLEQSYISRLKEILMEI